MATILEHLEAAADELVNAAGLALRSPSSADLLGQSLELLEMAAGAAAEEDPGLERLSSEIMNRAEEFLNVLTAVDESFIQGHFQALLTAVAMLKDCLRGFNL